MKIIKTLIDLRNLEVSGSVPEDLMQFLAHHFGQLHESLSPDQPLDEFSLEEHGYIILLEQGDNARNLSCVGLTGKEGLLGTWPEYVEQINLGTSKVYKIVILYDNEYMMTFFAISGSLSPEIEIWMAEHLETR